MKREAIAIITARGGSKRIPGKNIRDFCGKPIIAYSIEAALESNLFSEVMVSTDSKEIANVAEQFGARVPFLRSAKTADDFATTSDVVLEVLKRYRERGEEFTYTCCIYPTAPFITPQKLCEAMKLMKDCKPIEVFPVVPFSYPPQRCLVIEEDKSMRYRFPEYMMSRSQDLESWYHDAGQFYIYRTEEYVRQEGKISGGFMPIIVSELEAQDIDTEEDWEAAVLKYQYMCSRRKK